MEINDFVSLLKCPACWKPGLEPVIQNDRTFLHCKSCSLLYAFRKNFVNFMDSFKSAGMKLKDFKPEKLGEQDSSRTDLRMISYNYYTRHKAFFKKADIDFKSTVVDVGCSAGVLAQNFENYVGLDLSEDLENVAKDNPAKFFVRADAMQMPFVDNCFDSFVSRHLLEHTPTPRKVLSELKRVCRSGGVLELPVKEFPFLFDPLNFTLQKMKKQPKKFGIYGFGHQRVFATKEWDEIITSTFKIKDSVKLCRGAFYNLICLFENILFSRKDDYDVPSQQVKK